MGDPKSFLYHNRDQVLVVLMVKTGHRRDI